MMSPRFRCLKIRGCVPRFVVLSQSRLCQLQPVLHFVPLRIIVSQPIRLRTTRAIDETLVWESVGYRGRSVDNLDERDHRGKTNDLPGDFEAALGENLDDLFCWDRAGLR
jgi:hypothetical protein